MMMHGVGPGGSLTGHRPLRLYKTDGTARQSETVLPKLEAGGEPKLTAEFVLPVLDNRERRRRHRSRRAHDEPLAIWRHVELKVPGGTVLRGSRDSEEK